MLSCQQYCQLLVHFDNPVKISIIILVCVLYNFCLSIILSQLESLPKDELIKFVKKQNAVLKQSKAKCDGKFCVV